MTDRFRDRLSEYRDGELEPSEEALVQRHLEECDECVHTLADLEAVAEKAGALPDRAPESDLWSGIASRIESGADARPVTPVTAPVTTAGAWRFARRVTLTIPQLAAAAVTLAALSTAGAWMALGGASDLSVAAAPDAPTADGTELVSSRPADADPLAARYGSVITELEDALFDPSNSLSPDTEASLRRALLKIDRAIEDAEKALEALPGDAYLEEHVEATMRRKEDFLRRAVRLSQS